MDQKTVQGAMFRHDSGHLTWYTWSGRNFSPPFQENMDPGRAGRQHRLSGRRGISV